MSTEEDFSGQFDDEPSVVVVSEDPSSRMVTSDNQRAKGSDVSLRAEEEESPRVTAEEAIAELQCNHVNSIPERIRKNKTNEYIDELKAQAKNLTQKKKKKTATSHLIVDKLTLDHLKNLKKVFQDSVYSQSDQTIQGAVPKNEMRCHLEKVCHASFQDEEWNLIFIKMDVNCNGYVCYDEFINYLLLEFRIKENLEEDIALWMLEDPVQDLPTFIRSHHRHGVIDIAFSPLVKRPRGGGLRKSSFANGKYLTVSEQGTINTWSLNMELENSQECPSPVLHLAKTCVLKVVALADINLLAVSSTERDLRFYDTTGRHYQLKTRIVKLPFPATALHYHFYEDIEIDSLFVFGDSDGTISLLKFSSKQGGPLKKFERTAKSDYQVILYEALLKDAYADLGMTMTTFKNVHAGVWVMRIMYSSTIWPGKEVIVSCANTINCSLVVIDVTELKILKKFKIPRGVNTFCLAEGVDQIVVTGGFDTMIRLWHVKSPKKPTASMSGHYAPIDALYEQHKGARIFSISRDRVIKVWDTKEMVCIQTCTNKLQELGEAPMVCFYNPFYRKVILAGNNIAYFKLGSEINKFFSEGYTHVSGVTKALYNPLFKVIVTVGMDSNIMTWNPWKGKLVFVVRKAHTKHVFGENKPMGISSAIFSPSKVYLLTGALDGSIKMWNFTIGTCLRTMNIEEDCVVTGLVWVPGRILACGWNMHVSEWEDKIEQGDCKEWMTVHTKDILAMVQCGPKAIVTAAYNGELVFYNLQNGHYYNRFFVGKPKLPMLGHGVSLGHGTHQLNVIEASPRRGARHQPIPKSPEVPGTLGPPSVGRTKRKIGTDPCNQTQLFSHSYGFLWGSRITMGFAAAFRKEPEESSKPRGEMDESVSLYTLSESSTGSEMGRPVGVHKTRDSCKTIASHQSSESDTAMKKKHGATKSPLASLDYERSCDCEPPCPCEAQVFKGFAGPDKMEVHSLLFLQQRPDHPDVGTLFVSLQTGTLQLWSHHPKGGLVDSFYAVHLIGDYVTTMATDEENVFLFVGTRYGYVKIWHIENYCVLPEMLVYRCMPELRLEFPFLMNDRILGRAKRAIRGQEEPFLCSSCRNHLDRIMHIELLSRQKVYTTCGLDRTVRLWTWSGKYIGVLGGVNPWIPIEETEEAYIPHFRIPADLTRVLSSTSFKVLTARCHDANMPRAPPSTEGSSKTDVMFEYRYREFDEIFRGICDFPEENADYEIRSDDASKTDIIQKNIKEPVLRVLNMLKTVGQYDVNPPKGDRLARSIRQLLEDQERKWVKGRPTPPGQPTRTRPKERWVDRLPSHQRFWRNDTVQDQEAAQSILPQKSETSVKTISSTSTRGKQGLSQDAKNLEILLKQYEESAKGWYKQQS